MSPTIAYITQSLSAVYPPDEARALALWLVEELTGKTRSELLLGQEPMEIRGIDDCIRRLLAKEPVQYIFGHTEWMGLRLRVTPATLIPRPETGELVRWIAEDASFRKNGQACASEQPMRVLDIGTGSGCIAIALKKRFPLWEVTGRDVSEAALQIARENAERNGVDVRFEKADILSFEREYAFDMVVSNPPYVTEKEKAEMDENVLRYEPATALFVPDDNPLLFYRAIVHKKIAPTVYFEINERMGDAVRGLLQDEGYRDAVIRRDSYGKDRMARGQMIIDN